MTPELRSSDDARGFVLQGLHLQRLLPVRAETVRTGLEWALEIAAAAQPLPPVGFVADLGFTALGRDREGRHIGELVPWPPGLARAYEDHVLGKVFADASFERAADALRRYQGRDQARALAFVVGQMRERLGFGGVHLSPAVLKSLLREPPEQVLAAGTASLGQAGLMPLLADQYQHLIAAMRRAAELLAPEDLFELEHGTALQELGQRLALRQVLRAADVLELSLPRHRPRPRPGRREVPTRVLDEDTYPVGGFASLSPRGSIESLLHSQLALMEDERPDLFDLKYLRDELLYYSRDENQFLRRRQTFVLALAADLAAARLKDAELPYQRVIVLLGCLVALVRRLIEWLSSDALHFQVIFMGDAAALAHERQLAETIFREQIANGTVTVRDAASVGQVKRLCVEAARRSLCRCLTVSTGDLAFAAERVEVARLEVSSPRPVLRGVEGAAAGEGMEAWGAALGRVLADWV
jgi:hypothetical protein